MFWRYLRQFPKFFIAFLIIVASLVILFIWEARRAAERARPALIEDTSAREAQVEAKQGRLILVDNNLYDIDSGAMIFKDWLEKKLEMPKRLFYDREAKKFIAQYDLGFVRYSLSGADEAHFAQRYKPAFSNDLKWMLYVKDKDIWRADVDWKEFKVVNERKITSIEQFMDANFAENIFVGTEKTLVVRNLNNLLRVNLETGDVKPFRIPLGDIAKRRSPDSKSVVGNQTGQFYCYDMDSDAAKTVSIGRGLINDYQWLNNNQCVAIANFKTVVAYDGPKNALTEVTALPFQCINIGEPSPDGRFVFCTGRGKGVLVDLEKRTATQVTGGAGVCWVSNDTFAFSREVPDTELRGTWLQTVGEGERRVSPEPYLVGNAGGFIMPIPSAGMFVFATQHGLSKMKADGSEVTEFATLTRPPVRALAIQDWKQ